MSLLNVKIKTNNRSKRIIKSFAPDADVQAALLLAESRGLKFVWLANTALREYFSIQKQK